MYLVYGKGEKTKVIEGLKERADSRGKELKFLEEGEYSEQAFLSFIDEERRDIEVLIYMDIGEEKIIDLSKKIENRFQDIYQIVMNRGFEKNLEENSKVDRLIGKRDLLVDSLFKNVDESFFGEKSRRLKRILGDCEGEMAIFVHDDPDPDAIASAVGMEEICRKENVECETYFGGEIGHPENEIFMENTNFVIQDIDEHSIEPVIEDAYNVAFVDFAESSTSDIIPDYVTPDVIIDHHSTNTREEGKKYTEIRTDVGATSTLITKHLQNLDIDIPPVLASAMLFGIKVDTNDYTKNISVSDFKAIAYLNSIADKDILDILESPPIYSDTLSAMGRALSERKIEGDILTTYCGQISHSDDVSMIANFLLRERDILTVLVYGIKDKKIHMSVRSKDLQLNVGKIMDRAYSDLGEGGGHPHSAGGQISLNKFEDIDEAVEKIRKRFQDEVD